MKRYFTGIGAALALMSGAAQAQQVETTLGTVEGATSEGISSYLGIPYAAPPVGENRWRSPRPAQPWDGVRAAKAFGSDCAQAPGTPRVLPGLQTEPAEDCLFVNVWTPAGAKPGDDLPVVVWVHGGGFVYGGSSQPIYGGQTFARDGVIFVSLNYRLGRFGFFAHPALVDEGFGGNFAIEDQIAALRWVQSNIASFGGSPDRVTIFGESAGGIAMHMLLQAPAARGLFQGVMIQSGGGRASVMPPSNIAGAAAFGERFAPGLDAEGLRALSTQDVIGDLSMGSMARAAYSGPMIDGRTYLGDPLAAADNGLYPDVPILLGANSADGFPMSQDKDQIFAQFGNEAERAREFYDPDGTKGGLEVATMTSADTMFIEPARAIGRVLAGEGRDVWLYRFDHIGIEGGAAMGGAPHASEIPFVFDLADIRLRKIESPQDATVSAIAHGYWVNFAKTGNPNGPGLPEWPQMTADDTGVQLIGTDETAHVEDPRTAILDFREALLEE